MSERAREILFVHGADEWYGSDVVLYDIVRSLEGTEFSARVIVPTDSASQLRDDVRLSGRLRAMGVPVVSLPLGVMRRRYMTASGIGGLVRRTSGSVGAVIGAVDPTRIVAVHSHTATVLTGALVARKLGVPHVWHVSEIVERPRIVNWMLTRAIERSATRVIAVSHSVREHLATTVPAIRAKCDVIHNSVDTSRVGEVDVASARARIGVPTSGRVVGMVGRVGTMKGQEVLLAAAPAILRAHPETTFLLVGGVLDGRIADMHALEALATRLGVRDHVVIRDFDEDVGSVIAAMDVLVQPSVRPESFGMTVVEAMAAGIPVVASAHGGALETVSDGETGLLVPPRDCDALANAINKLLSDDTLRARMGRAGRARAAREFSYDTFAERYRAVYTEIADGR